MTLAKPHGANCMISMGQLYDLSKSAWVNGMTLVKSSLGQWSDCSKILMSPVVTTPNSSRGQWSPQ